MRKTKLIFIVCILMFEFILFIAGCAKSEKDVQKPGTNKSTEQLDTSKFFISSDSKYWQNYSGDAPDGSDLLEMKDSSMIEKIKMSIMGRTNEDVYTCEMHPQVHQNYTGKCPVCKMDLIKQEKYNKSDTLSNKKIKLLNFKMINYN